MEDGVEVVVTDTLLDHVEELLRAVRCQDVELSGKAGIAARDAKHSRVDDLNFQHL